MIAMVGVQPQGNGTALVTSVMNPEDGSAHALNIEMSRRERLWLAVCLLGTLLRR